MLPDTGDKQTETECAVSPKSRKCRIVRLTITFKRFFPNLL